MKYTININQFALFTSGLLGKVDYTDIAILEYLKDFVYYKDHKSLYIKGTEYIWLNYKHLMDSLPFAYLTTKGSVSKRIANLKKVELINTYKAPDNSLYYTFTEKMMDLCFARVKFTTKSQSTQSNTKNNEIVGQGFSPANKESRPKGLPYSGVSAVKDSNGFSSMAGSVWKVLSHIKERQWQNQK